MDSAERIERDIETLAGPDYTLSDEAIRRYAYTQKYGFRDYRGGGRSSARGWRRAGGTGRR